MGEDVRQQLAAAARPLWERLDSLAHEWTEPIFERLNEPLRLPKYPKTINDPVWGTITLLPREVIFLDSPLLQRLRRVCQLGLAHFVYPGATHNRLEHSLGVMEAAQRMMDALARNARFRKDYPGDGDFNYNEIEDADRVPVRLAALLHDVGHGPFSHASEPVLRLSHGAMLDRAQEVLRSHFKFGQDLQPSEIIAAIVIMSPSMRRILEHSRFDAPGDRTQLSYSITARLLGSTLYCRLSYLTNIVSGLVDADKLDYIARDAHHSGIPIALDADRLMSKLEVVSVRPTDDVDPELQARAKENDGKYLVMGVSEPGVSAYEQLVISRVFLYDRLYYHHKIRAAEEMVRCALWAAEEERGAPFEFDELLQGVADDAVLGHLAALKAKKTNESPGQRTQRLVSAVRDRGLYYRAFAFGEHLVGAVKSHPKIESDETKGLIWTSVKIRTGDEQARRTLRADIVARAMRLAEVIPELRDQGRGLTIDDVIINIPRPGAVVKGQELLTTTDRAEPRRATLYFNSAEWSKAYEKQKFCGYVFAAWHRLAVVALASQIVFAERYSFRTNEYGDHATKAARLVKTEWIDTAAARGLCSSDAAEILLSRRVQLALVRAEHIRVPSDWFQVEPSVVERLERECEKALRAGLPSSTHRALVCSLEAMCSFIATVSAGDDLRRASFPEAELQKLVRNHLRSVGVDVAEAERRGAGITDLVLAGSIVLELKVRSQPGDDGFSAGPEYAWQARDYSVALCRKIGMVLVAYRVATAAGNIQQPQRVRITRVDGSPEEYVQVRMVLPWGPDVPSERKPPGRS